MTANSNDLAKLIRDQPALAKKAGLRYTLQAAETKARTNSEGTWAKMAKWFFSLHQSPIHISIALLVGIGLVVAFPGLSLASYVPDSPAPLAPVAEPTASPNSIGMGTMDPHERLARPPMSDPPTQIELGHAEYWMSCMVCHGERGQGLTEEWRSVLDPADQNCWQSRCHAANHPPEGFQIPREAPLVMGTGALSGYRTATELYEYMRVDMPWSFPGLFSDEKYWEMTAYLAEKNKIELPREPLSPENGEDTLLVSGLVQAHHDGIGIERILAVAVLVLLLGALIFGRWPQRRESEQDG